MDSPNNLALKSMRFYSLNGSVDWNILVSASKITLDIYTDLSAEVWLLSSRILRLNP